MANFFDQFDDQAKPPAAQQNFFDRFDAAQPQAPQSSVADFLRSIPRGMMSGLVSATSGPVIPESPVPQPPEIMGGNAPAVMQTIEDRTGPMYQPQGRSGRFGAAVGEMLGSPLSYVGPGSLPLKVGGAILGGLGSEAGGQALEGTKYEGAGRIAGGLAGGVAAGKTLGPSTVKAAIPTVEELKAAATKGYDAARNSGVVVDPKAFSAVASGIEQELSGPSHGFSPEIAGKTFGVLSKLQSPPAGAVVTASNLDILRQNLGHIASETTLSTGGLPKPTRDAAAAAIAADRLKSYMANLPQDHLMAGDAADYVRNINQANGDYAAAMRAGDVGARLSRAENAANRQQAGSIDTQIKAKLAPILDNPQRQRGLTQEEIAQIQKIHDGTFTSNTLRQAGRFGSGVVPMMAHAVTAVGTGGASLPAQLAVGVPLYTAKKLAEMLTKRQANKLDDMLRMRSPEYNSRLQGIPPSDSSPQAAALARALMSSLATR